jgi:uncharacterized protein YceK
MKNLFLIAVCISLLSGCSAVMRIVDYGAAANTTAVKSSIFTLCDAASIGSIRREFATAEKVEVWKRLCDEKTDFEP